MKFQRDLHCPLILNMSISISSNISDKSWDMCLKMLNLNQANHHHHPGRRRQPPRPPDHLGLFALCSRLKVKCQRYLHGLLILKCNISSNSNISGKNWDMCLKMLNLNQADHHHHQGSPGQPPRPPYHLGLFARSSRLQVECQQDLHGPLILKCNMSSSNIGGKRWGMLNLQSATPETDIRRLRLSGGKLPRSRLRL